MLAFIRRFAKSPAASGLMALLVLSFAVFGISDVFRNAGRGDAVVQAGARVVTGAQFKSMFDRYLQGLAQQNGGQAPTVQDADAQGFVTQALNEVASEESAASAINRAGIVPSDASVADELGKAQRFRNPVTGAFDKQAYASFLRDQRLSAKEVEGGLRDQIAQRQFLTGLVAALQAPAAYTAVQAAFNGEARDFSYVTLKSTDIPAPAKPTDAEMQAFLKANAAQLTRPETRQVSLVRFSAAQLAATVPADPAEVKKRYDFEKDSLSTPEKRSVAVVPLKSPGQAADVVARLKKGEAPQAVAKAIGTEAVVTPDAPKTAIPDAAVAAAAFSMAQGEVKGPVQGALGAFVVQVSAITPGKETSLEEARPKLEAEVKKAAAGEKADALATKFDDAKGKGADFAKAAAAAGVTVTPLPAFTAQGATGSGQPLPVPKKLIATAFQLPKGGESELMQAGPGESYAIRVDAINPAAPLTLDEVRAPLSARMAQQRLAEAMQKKADEITAAAKAKGSLDGLAGAVQHVQGITRTIAQQPGSPYPPALLGRVFGSKPGEVVDAPAQTAPGQPLTLLIARIEKVTPASPTVIATASRTGKSAASVGLFEDMSAHVRDGARAEVKPRIDTARARAALGLDPATKPAAPASPAK